MEIREKIEEILIKIVPEIDVTSDNLMEEDCVESLTMIQLISELDLAFDIEITFKDIEEDNFHSVEAIEKMVRNYLK